MIWTDDWRRRDAGTVTLNRTVIRTFDFPVFLTCVWHPHLSTWYIYRGYVSCVVIETNGDSVSSMLNFKFASVDDLCRFQNSEYHSIIFTCHVIRETIEAEYSHT